MSTPWNESTGRASVQPMLSRPFAISKVRKELDGVFTFWLEPPEGSFTFAPGQFNMLYVFGNGEVPISISGDPQNTGQLVHTVRAVGKTTRALCALKKGQSLGVRGPYGASWPMEEIEGADVLLVTSGLGLAPLRPALYHLLNHRDKYRHLTLLYGARNPGRLLYKKELSQWMSRLDFRVEVAVGSAGWDWAGHIGVATSLISQVELDPERSVALICSSERMMRAMADELNHAGLTDDRIYLSLERNMQCGLGLCGHCQLGSRFICKDGPVYRLDQIARLLSVREL